MVQREFVVNRIRQRLVDGRKDAVQARILLKIADCVVFVDVGGIFERNRVEKFFVKLPNIEQIDRKQREHEMARRGAARQAQAEDGQRHAPEKAENRQTAEQIEIAGMRQRLVRAFGEKELAELLKQGVFDKRQRENQRPRRQQQRDAEQQRDPQPALFVFRPIPQEPFRAETRQRRRRERKQEHDHLRDAELIEAGRVVVQQLVGRIILA